MRRQWKKMFNKCVLLAFIGGYSKADIAFHVGCPVRMVVDIIKNNMGEINQLKLEQMKKGGCNGE